MGYEAQAAVLPATEQEIVQALKEGGVREVDPGLKLRHGLKVKNLPARIAALERQGFGVVPPEVMASVWRRIWWALWI